MKNGGIDGVYNEFMIGFAVPNGKLWVPPIPSQVWLLVTKSQFPSRRCV